jgi:hypothetical protein
MGGVTDTQAEVRRAAELIKRRDSGDIHEKVAVEMKLRQIPADILAQASAMQTASPATGDPEYQRGYSDGQAGNDSTSGPIIGDGLESYNRGFDDGQREAERTQTSASPTPPDKGSSSQGGGATKPTATAATTNPDAERIAALERNYRGWLTEAVGGQGDAWSQAAEALNGMSPDDIRKRLAELSHDQILALQQAAIQNGHVGPGAQIVGLCAEALKAGSGAARKVDAPTPDTVGTLANFLEGHKRIKDLVEAKKRYDEIKEYTDPLKEVLTGEELGPLVWLKQIKDMAVHLFHDSGTEEQGCRLRAWCYTVVYEPLGMGVPPRPDFTGKTLLKSSDELNATYWDKGVAEAQTALADGSNGLALINKVLLLAAAEGPGTVLNEIWKGTAKEAKYDKLLKAYEQLPWPGPLGI